MILPGPADSAPNDAAADGVMSAENDTALHLTLDEYGQLCEFMFNLGATYMSMQLHAEQEDVRGSEVVEQMWKTPAFAELERRRRHSDEPCGVRTCRTCSRCVRADAVKRGAVRS